jgi:hypothetical protein
MITILLCGQARVGKTTAANYISKIAKKEGFRPIILPFAEPIKQAAEEAGLFKDKDPEAYRKFCQEQGGGKRKEDPDFWLNKFLDKWKDHWKKDEQAANDPERLWAETVVIVDDCRYLNELNAGKTKMGAVTVFISSGDRELEDPNGEWRKHDSEDMANQKVAGNKDYQDIFEWVIKNDKDQDTYLEKIKERIPYWLGLDASIMCACDCVGCLSYKKDEPAPQELMDKLFDEIERALGLDEEEEDNGA